MRKFFRQPKDTLHPSAFSLEAAERWALKRAKDLPEDLFRLKALWYVKMVIQPAPLDRNTRYTIKIAQTENYGCATGLSPVLSDPDLHLVGKDARRVLKNRVCKDVVDRTAIVDSVMGLVSRPADQKIMLDADSSTKYLTRAQTFATEAIKVLKRKGRKNLKGPTPHILVIGATAGFLDALVKQGFKVSATDLWPEVIGEELGGVKVQNGKTWNARLMRETDLAIITGMALINGTLRSLTRLAKKHNTSTIIWAITGRNFGNFYTEHGVDSVVSDPSPFLLLPGPTSMEIWRQKE